MNPSNVTFVLTLYKDHVQAAEMLRTLCRSRLPGDSHWDGQTMVVIKDATESGVPEGLLQDLRDATSAGYSYTRYYNRPGLPEVMNDAIKESFREQVDYVAWIHPDMDFSYDPMWLARCVLWLEDEPVCGKVSPSEYKTWAAADAALKSTVPTQGNACPWVMRTVDLKELWDREGWVLDPAYKLMHYEDWDLINRINLELGKVAHIIPWAQVVHEGMGTRKSYDYEDSLQVNRKYFEQKWGMKQHL